MSHHHRVTTFLYPLFHQIEDMCIEHLVLRELLISHYGFSDESINDMQRRAKKDPDWRFKAANGFAGWKTLILDSMISILLEESEKQKPRARRPRKR